jgi:putative tryptophan/tyrosine transport system substrate-binding protein
MRAKILAYALPALILATIHLAEAQQPKKVPRIGYLVSGSPSSTQTSVDAFRQGLHDLGYVEGKNILIEYRYAEGKDDRLRDFAADLVRVKVDMIVTSSTVGVSAAKQLTGTIPIVMTDTGDPVATGLVASLAKPGGNVTGLSALSPELSTKQLELLKEILPRVSRVAVLFDPGNPVNIPALKEIEHIAPAFGIQLLRIEVRSPEDYEPAFSAVARGRADALLVRRDPLNQTHRTRIVSLATQSKLPAVYPVGRYVEVGGLMSYGVNGTDQHRRAATYVDKILKGAKPADLPVEQPIKFEFIINLKAAKQIGLTIPPNVLARADRVIR